MMKLRLSLATTLVAVAAGTSAQAATVLVGPDDTLAYIALRHLGDAKRWHELCALNAALLKDNCDRVLPGTLLVLPDGSGTAPAVVRGAAVPAAELPITLGELPAELITVSPTDSPEVMDGVVSPNGGQRRVRYTFHATPGTVYHVSWPLKIDTQDLSTVLVYDSQIIGQLDFSGSDRTSPVGASGVITKAAVIGSEDGWIELSFNLARQTDGASIQLLLYPVGVSSETRQAEPAFQFSPPTVTVTANERAN